MPDTSNQIIQTLEAIHNDIKAAKSTLKENNVELVSNSTSTLSTEINKIPVAIKESDELINFNNGKTSLYHGFLINKENIIHNTIDNNDFILAPTDDRNYKFPDNVFINFDHLPKIPFGTDDSKCKKINNTQIASFYCGKNNYSSMLKALFTTSINNNIGFFGYDTEIYDVYIDENNTITYDEQTNIFKFNSSEFFYMPGVNGQIFVGNKPVTKVNTDKFILSANVNTRYVECNTLKILVDVIHYIAGGIYNGAVTDPTDKIIRDESFRGHTKDKDAYIIVMKNADFEFSHSGSGANILPKIDNVYNDNSLGNIQIRVDDTNPENLKKLHNPKVMANVLQLFTVRNLDGTKIYSYKQNKFIDESSFTSLKDEVIYDDVYDLEEDLNVLNLKAVNTPPVTINTSLILPNFDYKDIKQDLSDNNLNETNGMVTNNSKGLYLFKNYNDKYNLSLFGFNTGIVSNALYKIKDKLVKIKNTSMYGTYDSLPLVYLASRGSGYMQTKYDFKGIEIYNSVYKQDEEYDDTSGIGLLLASPYQTKFLTDDSNNIESIVTNKAAITYNKNIKTVKFKENSIAYTLLSIDPNPYLLTNLYNSDNSTLKLDQPTNPIKFIFTNTTKLKNINKFTGKRVSQLVLGAYTTSELAKFYDKFINILVPEDYPYLDSFDFAKYRLPVYNLDKTKKYNYSKKTWEPITALTDDSTSFAELYPDKAYYYTECNEIKDASFR